MKFNKGIFTWIVLVIVLFNSCNFKNSSTEKDKITIVVTTFPIYDWVKNIVQEKAEVKLLLDSSADLHSWQPSAKDIVTISGPKTDLFISIGGTSDFWIKKLIPQMEKNGVKYFSIIEKSENLLLPYQNLDDKKELHSNHEHHNHHNHHDEGDVQLFDEHIWLSLKSVPFFIEMIANEISLLDESNKDFYLGNAKSYIEKINELQKKGIQIVNNSKTKVMVVADRFPFLYFAKDFGLEYFAAFEGCSSETDASFDVILALSEKMIEHNLSSIVITETGNDKLVKTIIQQVEKSRILNGVEKVQSSDIQIKVLNSIQGKVLDSESYLSIMNKNLEILFDVLN